MFPNAFDYEKPKNLAQAFSLLTSKDAVILAGGTDLILALRDDKIQPDCVVDIKALRDLQGIEALEEGGVRIGAATLIQDMVEHPLIAPYTALVQGAGVIGCYEIRCRATLGGNICNGSPSADSVPGLLLYDAQVVLASEQESRTLPLESFLLGPGRVDLRPGELLTAVLLPPPAPQAQSRYFRSTRVKGMDLSSVSVGVYCEGPAQVRIALGAVTPTVSRARQGEALLAQGPLTKESLNQALEVIQKGLAPRKSSLRATPEYKIEMVGVFVRKALGEMLGGDFDE